ncbi:Clp protease N-terminal domain-containing protein [Streptomyces sp. NPDC127068]|uniref:Clp protease N-terminal domain-containing protein n=1 Tax=Streptomyces sp. NPDC127068 TaxID=3347127 RepID=UPI00365FAFD8
MRFPRPVDGVGDVHLPLPQQPAPGGATPLPTDDLLSVEMIAVVAGARRRAVRDGDRQVDTAHLLHSLLEADPLVRALFGDGPQAARLLGYLVQRSIGYGLQWQSSVEDSGVLPVVRDAVGVARWSPAAAAAMDRAVLRARARGDERAGGLDLFVALATDRECRAVEVLLHAGVAPAQVVARAEAGPADAGCEERGGGAGGRLSY